MVRHLFCNIFLLPRFAACPNFMYSHNKHDIRFCIPEKVKTCGLNLSSGSSEDVMLRLFLNVVGHGFFLVWFFFFLQRAAVNSKVCLFSDCWSCWSEVKMKLLQTLNQITDVNSLSFDWQEILWSVIIWLKNVRLKMLF